MAYTIRALGLIIAELWPLFVLMGVVGVVAWARLRPLARELAAWKVQRKRIEAEIVRLSHTSGEVEALVAAEGELAAHDVMRPDVPRWAFWLR